MLIMMSEIQTALQKQPSHSSANTLRKRYGNLKQLFAKEDLGDIFTVDKDTVGLRGDASLEKASKANRIRSTDYEAAKSISKAARKRYYDILRRDESNLCARCGESYSTVIDPPPVCRASDEESKQKSATAASPVAADKAAAATTTQRHTPCFDWSLSATDSLACQVRQPPVSMKVPVA